MIKTVWVSSKFQKKGKWEEYEEPTGEVKKGIFGEKAVMAKKKRWVELNEYSDCLIDGKRLAHDVQAATNALEEEGFEVIGLSEVLSGQYNWTGYSRSGPANGAADTCASWGFSITEGIIVTAKKR